MALTNLDKHLNDWQTHGFLTSDQAHRIRQFEAARAPASRLMLALTLLAVLSIGLGIISLIAANWDAIPGWFKLGCYFVLMFAQIFALQRWDQKSGLVREGLHVLYILSILAGIGLIAQIFHVPSDGWRGAALWSILSLGVMLRARSWYTVVLWYGSFSWAWLAFVFQGSSTHAFMRFEWLLFTVTCFCILASWKGRWTLPEPQRTTTLLLGSFVVVVMGPWCMAVRPSSSVPTVWEYAGAAALAALWLGVLRQRLTRSQWAAAAVVALGFFARWGVADFAHRDLLNNLPNFLDTVIFVVQMSALGLLALHWDRGRIFDALTLLMAARIFTLFFTLFGTLFMTGAGLIIFGALVLGLLHLWYRYHDRLQTRLKDILQ
ncbi:MAG TPA: DUF2157 domain-containing protein [Oligoflexus sp.]|uniref:DUF2157 domain-containing protein n=1 Tax=Oligoflexus sp. TaxID=1971216 RepID=UPI002D39D0B3|nr:DUF2157 domain-containing protein [Oligoflexus sp.]HYX38826.1 DUF2157 domain-containing protein [Oligoflexus sp.]